MNNVVKTLMVFCAGVLLSGNVLSLQIAPAYQILEVKAGKKANGELTLFNNEKVKLYLTPSTKDWFTTPENEMFKVSDWMILEAEEMTLDPGDTRKIALRIKVPKRATGELMGMASFSSRVNEQTMIKQVFSVAVYVAVKGTEKIQGELGKLVIEYQNRTLKAGVFIENTGNVHIRPAGIIQILNNEEQIIANVLMGKGSPTFPGKERFYFGDVPNFSLKPGRYIARIDMRDVDHQVSIVKAERTFKLKKNGKVKL